VTRSSRRVVSLVLVFGVLALRWLRAERTEERAGARPDQRATTEAASPSTASASVLAEAFRAQRSNVQVEGLGVVRRVLPDDADGSRHQRFILALRDGQTVLVAHNIDLAARLGGLDRGDTVAFFGEYEWNPDGGVIHWTHRDPAGRHVAGWLRHEGRTVQ
jgi:hypothetical protein